MKVLLAGAFGNLGIEILRVLIEGGHEIIAADLKEKENNGLEGKGKFVIDTNNPFVEKTKEQFVKDFNTTGQKDDILTLYNLLNGTIRHKMEGEIKITRESVNAKEYEVTYTGSGTYSFEAEVVDRVDNYEYEGLFEQQNIKSDDVTTRQVEQEGNVTLKYTTKLQ